MTGTSFRLNADDLARLEANVLLTAEALYSQSLGRVELLISGLNSELLIGALNSELLISLNSDLLIPLNSDWLFRLNVVDILQLRRS